MSETGYLPLVAGTELVRRSQDLTQYDPDLLLGTLPPPPDPEPEED